MNFQYKAIGAIMGSMLLANILALVEVLTSIEKAPKTLWKLVPKMYHKALCQECVPHDSHLRMDQGSVGAVGMALHSHLQLDQGFFLE